MTALGGYVSAPRRPDVSVKCAAILAGQAIYGPSAPLQWTGDGAALGRRLFATLPEDVHDSGPVIAGPLVLIADVRLDNRADLVASLGLNERSKTLSDAALLMRAFVRWNEAAIDRLSGDFALGLWNCETRRLLLARDFLGQRPLHYHRGNGFVAFASMPKGLHALAEIPRRPDAATMRRFLARAPTEGRATFFEAIEQVEAGHIVIIGHGHMVSRRYWNPSRAGAKIRSVGEAQEGLRERLDEAVGARLRGAPDRVGAHLSGGLDSSAVAATAARLLAPEKREVIAFTAVPRGGTAHHAHGRIADEGPLAAESARLHPNMVHVPIASSGISPLDVFDRNLALYERPMPNACNDVWINAINAAAKERGLNVVLTGMMGNLSFSYSGQEALADLLARGQWRRLVALAAAMHGRGRGWPGLVAQALAPFAPTLIASARNWRGAVSLESLALPARSTVRRACPSADAFDVRLQALRRVAAGNFGKGYLAVSGVDLRDPSADRRLVEFTLALPVEHFYAHGVPRGLVRTALADRLPSAVLDERRRGYQSVDWAAGLVAQPERLRAEVAAIARCPGAAAVVDVPRMQALINRWPEQWGDAGEEALYRTALLPALAAGHFMRHVLEPNA